MEIPDHHISLLRNLYAGQEATESDLEQGPGSKLGKEYIKTVFSPYLFNIYPEHIMQNSRLDEAQAGIKISRRNSNAFRYADDITFMAES